MNTDVFDKLPSQLNCGWSGTVQEFLRLHYEDLEEALMTYIYGSTVLDDIEEEDIKVFSQKKAWKDSFEKLKRILYDFRELKGSVIFEYAILRGSGRRPDVILILSNQILVIECKSYNSVNSAEYLQTSLYVRDLQNYHSTIQEFEMSVSGVLLLTESINESLTSKEEFQIYVASQKSLSILIRGLLKKRKDITISAEQFLKGRYQPSPSMLEAARSIMNNEELPRIKAVDSSNFQDVYDTVVEVIDEAKSTNTHHLVLVSGEPGAGKTFLGLLLAHNIDDTVYLSGNGPLVDVLQDTLDNKAFVQSLYAFKKDYLEYGREPDEKVLIFDEAQRAWDAKKMGRPLSEPDVIIQVAKNKPWGVVIGLIGEGQEIHLGEESGLNLWNSAIKNEGITIHTKHDTHLFNNAAHYREHNHFHLNASLRSHQALNYYGFVNLLLDGNIEEANKYKEPLQKKRYPMFITDNIDKAKAHLNNLYVGDSKTYGIVCASGADGQKEVTVIPRGERNKPPKPSTAFFNYPNKPFYCKRTDYAATEFHIQGLELDAVIVHWDDDLYWKDNKWHCNYTNVKAEDPQQLKINAYRVLLTRGRDETIIYIPNKEKLKSTWDLFANELKIPVL